jgi:hypothetical protein
MTSDSDDLEQQLQENLKLRRELAAEVAKAKDSASPRVSRGFHRLAVFLAGAVFIVAGLIVASDARDNADSRHKKLTCAHAKLMEMPASGPPWNDPATYEIDLKSLGCSDWVEAVSFDEARNPPSWLGMFLRSLGPGFGLTLAAALILYGLVRAIGWIIGGFVAS